MTTGVYAQGRRGGQPRHRLAYTGMTRMAPPWRGASSGQATLPPQPADVFVLRRWTWADGCNSAKFRTWKLGYSGISTISEPQIPATNEIIGAPMITTAQKHFTLYSSLVSFVQSFGNPFFHFQFLDRSPASLSGALLNRSLFLSCHVPLNPFSLSHRMVHIPYMAPSFTL